MHTVMTSIIQFKNSLLLVGHGKWIPELEKTNSVRVLKYQAYIIVQNS